MLRIGRSVASASKRSYPRYRAPVAGGSGRRRDFLLSMAGRSRRVPGLMSQWTGGLPLQISGEVDRSFCRFGVSVYYCYDSGAVETGVGAEVLREQHRGDTG